MWLTDLSLPHLLFSSVLSVPTLTKEGGTRGVVSNVLDSLNEVSKFEFQSLCYVHFWTNTTGKDINSLIPSRGIK